MRLERHILQELVGNFLFSAVAIFFVAGLLTVIQVFFASDLPMVSAITTVPLLLLARSEILLPCAFLFGVVFTYGRYSAEFEYMATQACGVHPFRSLTPVLVLGLLLTAGQLALLSYAIPGILLRADRITEMLAAQVLENFEPSRTEFEAKRAGFYMSWARRNGLAFEDVVLDANPGGAEVNGAAPQGGGLHGRADRVEVVFEPGAMRLWVFGFQTSGKGVRAKLDRFSISIPREKLLGGDAVRARPDFLASDALLALSIRFRWQAMRLAGEAGELPALARERNEREGRRMGYAFHRRAAWAFAPLVLGLLGAPIAIWFRRGTRLGALLLAFGVFLLVYFPLGKIGGDGLSEVGAVPVWASAWLATGVCAAIIGAFLFRIARR